jgi:flagellar biosynthesis chaperone FliJ
MRQDDEPTLAILLSELARISARLFELDGELKIARAKQVKAHTDFSNAFDAVQLIRQEIRILEKDRQMIEDGMDDKVVSEGWSSDSKMRLKQIQMSRLEKV